MKCLHWLAISTKNIIPWNKSLIQKPIQFLQHKGGPRFLKSYKLQQDPKLHAMRRCQMELSQWLLQKNLELLSRYRPQHFLLQDEYRRKEQFHLPRQFKICMHRETTSTCSQKKNVSMWSFMKDFCVKDDLSKKAKSTNNSIMDLTKEKI